MKLLLLWPWIKLNQLFTTYYYSVIEAHSPDGEKYTKIDTAQMKWGIGNHQFSIEECLTHIYYNVKELREFKLRVIFWKEISKRDYEFMCKFNDEEKKRRIHEMATGLQQRWGYKDLDG